jgi:hypothetical protein
LNSCFAGANILDEEASFPAPFDSLQRTSLEIAMETQEQWYKRKAVEQLAQHIPFEQNMASKAEQIEMLRGLVIHHGKDMDRDLFGFEARNELIRLGLWNRIGQIKPGEQEDD